LPKFYKKNFSTKISKILPKVKYFIQTEVNLSAEAKLSLRQITLAEMGMILDIHVEAE
jgi:hypothetical protein